MAWHHRLNFFQSQYSRKKKIRKKERKKILYIWYALCDVYTHSVPVCIIAQALRVWLWAVVVTAAHLLTWHSHHERRHGLGAQPVLTGYIWLANNLDMISITSSPHHLLAHSNYGILGQRACTLLDKTRRCLYKIPKDWRAWEYTQGRGIWNGYTQCLQVPMGN